MFDLFRRAGVVAWPLALCSILAVAIVLERLYVLAQLRRQERLALQCLRSAGPGGLRQALAEAAIASSPLAVVVAYLLAMGPGAGGDLHEAGYIAIALQRHRLRRYLGTLATIGATSPFVGLFGTVLGVMSAFHGMSRTGLSSELMASGISEALSATALGLVVAIPAVVAYNYFSSQVNGLVLEIQGDLAQMMPAIRSCPPPAGQE